jgi:UPF0271 protein
MNMDINSDMGEIPRLLDDGTYTRLMDYVTSINIACAGNEAMMGEMIRLAKEKGVKVGAHPSYPDRENFGRMDMDMDFDELTDSIRGQIQLLNNIAQDQKVSISHVKPHGAVYNRAAKDKTVAQALGEAVTQVDPSLKVMGLAGSIMLDVFDQMGLSIMAEAFADRTYEADGSLRNRKYDDALITEPEKAAKQTEMMVSGNIIAVDGSEVAINAQTLCIHSDTPNAVAIAKAVNKVIS